MLRLSLDSSGQFLRHGLGLGALLLVLGTRLAAQITIVGELDTATSQYSYMSGHNGSTSYLSASIKPSLDFAFSTAGDTQLTVTWSAPAGQKIVIAAPTDWTASVGIVFTHAGRTGSDFEGHGIMNATTFTDLTGSFAGPSVANVVFAPNTTTGISYYEVSTYLSVPLNTEVSFSSVSITYLVPASVNRDYASVTASDFALIGNASFSGAEVGNPGAWITLESTGAPIPEPATYAVILGLGTLGLVAWRRRARAA